MDIDFEYELPSGQVVVVEAEVSPLIPGKYGSNVAPEDAYPDEGGDIDIIQCSIKDSDNNIIEFDPNGLFYRPFGKTEFKSIVDDMEEMVWEAYVSQECPS